MCDYSLQQVRSRPAKVGDKLTTRDFGTGTRGFAASEDAGVAVCVLPGTELAFAGEIASTPIGPLGFDQGAYLQAHSSTRRLLIATFAARINAPQASATSQDSPQSAAFRP
jgi:hypothetical protein